MGRHTSSVYSYTIFGRGIRSAIALPLVPANPHTPSDVVVTLGRLPPGLDATTAATHRFTVFQDSVVCRLAAGAFIVVDGTTTMTVVPGGEEEGALAHGVVGVGMAAILIRQDVLPLHASAVSTPDGPIVCLGERGAGKSTLALAFARLGLPIMADDLTAVSLTGGTAQVLAGASYFKVGAFQPGTGLAASRGADFVQTGKTAWLVQTPPAPSSAPLRRLFVLGAPSGADPSITALDLESRVDLLHRHTYRRRLARVLGFSEWQRLHRLSLAGAVRMHLVRRGEHQTPDEHARVLLQAFAQCG